MEGLKTIDLRQIQPLINLSVLKEIELKENMKNVQLRHDIVFDPFLQFVTLFSGVFVGWYGIMDIWDDTISRTVEGSDAYACFQMWPCCLPRVVGVQFAILAICCQCLGLYIAMLSMMS